MVKAGKERIWYRRGDVDPERLKLRNFLLDR